jgi:hypothetical protein
MSTTTLNAGRLAGHWIAGEWIDSGEHHDSIDPATGEVIGQYAEAGPAEAERAIAAAKRAFRQTSWKQDRNLRARVLNAMATRFDAHREELVEILGLDNGKIRAHAELELDTIGTTLRFNAALAHRGGPGGADRGWQPLDRAAPARRGLRRDRAVELPGGARPAIAGTGARGGDDRRGHAADADRAGQCAHQPDHL